MLRFFETVEKLPVVMQETVPKKAKGKSPNDKKTGGTTASESSVDDASEDDDDSDSTEEDDDDGDDEVDESDDANFKKPPKENYGSKFEAPVIESAPSEVSTPIPGLQALNRREFLLVPKNRSKIDKK